MKQVTLDTNIKETNEVDEFLESIEKSNESSENSDLNTDIMDTISKHYQEEYQKLISENKDLKELIKPEFIEETKESKVDNTISFIFGKRLDNRNLMFKVYEYLNVLTKDGFNSESLENSFDYFYDKLNEFKDIEATLFCLTTYLLLLTDNELNLACLLQNKSINEDKLNKYNTRRLRNKEFVSEFLNTSIKTINTVDEYKDIVNIFMIYRFGIGYGDLDISIKENIDIAKALLKVEELKDNKLIKPFKEFFKI